MSMIAVGDIREGTVTGIMPFGAFVSIDGNQTGLVHISEVSKTYVSDINEFLKKGDKVRVKVIKIDDNGKISLSIKQAAEAKKEKHEKHIIKQERVRPDDFDWQQSNESELSFEDKLLKFKKISDENMHTVRKNAESKRSGGYSRRGNY